MQNENNGANNLQKIEEYIFIDNIQDFFQFKAATTTSWAFKFSGSNNKIDENSVFIFANVSDKINRMVFNKSDLKKISKIYQLIRIYSYNSDAIYVNIICNQNYNGLDILKRIAQLPDIEKMILEKLNIKQNQLNKFTIKDFHISVDNFDKVYQLQLNQKINNNNLSKSLNPNTYSYKNKTNNIDTNLVLKSNNNSFNNTNISSQTYIDNSYKSDYMMKNRMNNQMNIQMNNQFLNNEMKLNQMYIKNNQMMLNNINMQNQLILNQLQQNFQILNKNNQNAFRNQKNQNLLPNQKKQNFLHSQNNLNSFQNKNNPIIIKDQINPNFNENQSNQAFSQNQFNPNFNQNQFNPGFNQNNNAFSQNQFNPNFNQNQFNPGFNQNNKSFSQNQFNPNFNQNQFNRNLMQNNLLNNNQIQNNGISIDYQKEIEKNANEIFKFDFLKNFEIEYYPMKGLNNVGLTCYMNSTLQCLLHIPELTFFFVNAYIEFSNKYEKMIQKTETKGKISKEYKALLNEIFSNSRNFFGFDSSVSPKKFNDLISRLNPQFSKYQSNDAKDLIIYLLQEMHEELNYFGGQKLQKIPQCNQLDESDSFKFFYEVNSKMNFSIISYLFWGIVKQTTICKECKSTLFNFQYFQYLSFPLYRYANTKFNIYRGLKDYIAEEILTGDNQFYCQKCQNLRDAKIFSKIYYTSPYLLINLDYGKNKIYIPKEIDYGSIIILSKEFLEIKAADVTYDLIAVSSHIGSSGNSGHYITYCRDIKSDSWYKFNDSSVSKCDFENTKEYSPYLLLFKKVKQTFK